MMNLRLTPIVKNILIINILIWLILMVLPRVNQQASEVGRNYFELHKSDLIPIRPVVDLGSTKIFIRRSSKVTPSMALERLSKNPDDNSFLAAYADRFIPIQILTWFFSHFDFLHILFNMIVLISVGPLIERILGAKRFLAFYLFCGIVGGLMVAFLDPSPIPVLGASGAIFGLLLAFAMYYPTQQLQLFFFIPITALNLVKWAGIISAAFVVMDFIGIDLDRLGFMGSISHFGHLTGMIAALLFFYVEKFIPFLKE